MLSGDTQTTHPLFFISERKQMQWTVLEGLDVVAWEGLCKSLGRICMKL